MALMARWHRTSTYIPLPVSLPIAKFQTPICFYTDMLEFYCLIKVEGTVSNIMTEVPITIFNLSERL
jgi:hypothetical protein